MAEKNAELRAWVGGVSKQSLN